MVPVCERRNVPGGERARWGGGASGRGLKAAEHPCHGDNYIVGGKHTRDKTPAYPHPTERDTRTVLIGSEIARGLGRGGESSTGT